jgi:hypothetical protein
MNRIRIILGATCLLFVPTLYAQEPADAPKPPNEEARPEPNRDAPPAARQNDAQPSRQETRQDEARPPKQENERNQTERNSNTENARPERDQAKPGHEERGQAQPNSHPRPAGKSAHIPEEKFRASFGRQHTFVISRPVVVEGQPRFQYSGYWFEIVDAWPVDWAYTDDVYVDYIDGDYFLFDLLHPGVRVAVFVIM